MTLTAESFLCYCIELSSAVICHSASRVSCGNSCECTSMVPVSGHRPAIEENTVKGLENDDSFKEWKITTAPTETYLHVLPEPAKHAKTFHIWVETSSQLHPCTVSMQFSHRFTFCRPQLCQHMAPKHAVATRNHPGAGPLPPYRW